MAASPIPAIDGADYPPVAITEATARRPVGSVVFSASPSAILYPILATDSDRLSVSFCWVGGTGAAYFAPNSLDLAGGFPVNVNNQVVDIGTSLPPELVKSGWWCYVINGDVEIAVTTVRTYGAPTVKPLSPIPPIESKPFGQWDESKWRPRNLPPRVTWKKESK